MNSINKRQLLFETVRTALAILIALGVTLVLILFVSQQPGIALRQFLIGPLSSLRHFGNVLEMMIPMIFTGLAVSLMFSAAQFNLAAEGAFFMGGVAAAFVAVSWNLPPLLHPLTAILAGGLVGAGICSIPAYLKMKWNASELVSSLMFNYLALFMGLFIIKYFLRDIDAGAIVSERIPSHVRLFRIIPKTRVHFGLIIAIATFIACRYYMFRTRWGYRLRVTGANAGFARYAGINIMAVIMSSQVLGGMLAGMGGAIEILGMYRRFSWQALPGYGWDGIIVAILARNNPILVPLGAFFLAYLRIGADLMARTSDVQNEVVTIIQGIVIVLIVAESFLSSIHQRMVYKTVRK